MMLIFLSFSLQAQSPSQGSIQRNPFEALQSTQQFEPILRASPEDSGGILRQLQPTDSIQVLRSQNDWFEVDLTTQEGLQFRGWLKGGLPIERQVQAKPQEPAPQQDRQASRKPLRSERFKWVWFGEIDDAFSLGVYGGFQKLRFTTTGLQTVGDESSRIAAPGFDFNGFDLGGQLRFTLMSTEVGGRELRWENLAAYSYGLFSVSFGTGSLGDGSTIPAELQGVGYSIATQRFKFFSGADYQVLKNQQFSLHGLFDLGMLFFESAPDLRRTDQGNIVFTQLELLYFAPRLGLATNFRERFTLDVRAAPLFIGSVKEQPVPTGENQMEAQGIGLFIDALASYRINDHWSATLGVEWIKAKGKKTGTSNRINETYTNLEAAISNQKFLAGITTHF